MPVHFQRLDNALKRANEFIDVGKSLKALEILSDVLKSKKHRVWQQKHEEIMYKFLELCISLQKSFAAKEGLYQYKIICQQTYIKSFEEVVKKFLESAEAKALTAKEKIRTANIEFDLDDLDSATRPEEILLCAVSSEDTQDRNERVVLLPWVKFLWDSYRHCLELLRNNPRTERLYHDIAYQTFQFCIKFNRKPEMRKLCDSLHNHLEILKKLQSSATASGNQNIINLNNPESQGMHLETRLVQLDSAIKMELWQEAYKATDDIKKFGLMSQAKKQPKPQLMATYYQKLSLVFWKANCPLFHAAALFKFFNLSRELKKNITAEEVERLASKVVIAALAVPIPPTRAEIDKIVDTEENVIENHQRNLASLLGLSVIPTRTSLIKDLEKLQVLQNSYPILKNLYKWLEKDFNPLQLCNKVQSVVDEISANEQFSELAIYLNSIKDVAVIRLLKEISQVYQTLEYKRLIELCPFVNPIYLEQTVVSAARRNDLNVRIDHRRQCLIFGSDYKIAAGDELIEGPHIQNSPSDQLRRQLVNMYSILNKAMLLIEPNRLREKRNIVKSKAMEYYLIDEETNHQSILERQDFIERKKEELEQKGLEREKEERRELEEKQLKIKVQEEERLRKEQEERESLRKIRESEELQKRMTKDQIDKIKKTGTGRRIISDIGEEALLELKPEEIKSRQWKQLEKERKEQTIKQKKIERRIDHFERAKRIEEIPLLKQEYDEWKVKDQEIWTKLEQERIEQVLQEREQALKHKERLSRMLEDAEKFTEEVQKVRHEIYMSRLSEWQRRLDEEREGKLLQRKQERKLQRRREYIIEKQRQEAKRLAEEARKRKEEEYAEAKRQAEMQLRREKEAEERRLQLQKERQEEMLKLKEEQRKMDEEKRKSRAPEEDWRSSRANATPAQPKVFAERNDHTRTINRPTVHAAATERNWNSVRDAEPQRPAVRQLEPKANQPEFSDIRKPVRKIITQQPRELDREAGDDWRKQQRKKDENKDPRPTNIAPRKPVSHEERDFGSLRRGGDRNERSDNRIENRSNAKRNFTDNWRNENKKEERKLDEEWRQIRK